MENIDGFFLGVALFPVVAFFLLAALAQNRNLPNGRSKAVVVLWNVIGTVFLASTFFLVGESYYRFFVDTTDSFALSKLSQRWGKKHYHLNNLRSRASIDYQLEIGAGKRRLTIIGDSFTAGHGIEDVSDRFGNRIQVKYPDLEVHVLANNGRETIDEIQMFSELIQRGYQTDMVVLAYCLNDISYLIPETNKVYDRVFAFHKGLSFLERNSYLLNTYMFRQFAKDNPDLTKYYDFVISGYQGKPWEQQKRVLSDFSKLVKQSGGDFGVISFPFLHNIGKEYPFVSAHEGLDKFWKSIGVPHLDLLFLFLEHSEEKLVINKYDAHPNEQAHGLAAESIEKFLKSGNPELFK